MKASISLGTVWGIPVKLHWSWVIVFALVTVSLAQVYFVVDPTGLTSGQNWVLATIVSLLFFGSILAHEFGHGLMAIHYRIPVISISLFVFGGVAHIGEEPRTPREEFEIALAGPLTSLASAAVFGLAFLLFPTTAFITIPAQWLVTVNVAMAAFNMIPGFPLDGGRVFRAIVWWLTGDSRRSIRVASMSGQLVAYGFIGFGIFSMFDGSLVNGLWLAFIGWFLQNAASGARSDAHQPKTLEEVRVSEVMERSLDQVPANLSLTEVIQEFFLPYGRQTFFVADNGQPRGLLTIQEITTIPRQQWDHTRVDQVMTPWSRMLRVQSEMGLLAAMNLMDVTHTQLVPVMQGDQLAGLLSREQAAYYIQKTGAEI